MFRGGQNVKDMSDTFVGDLFIHKRNGSIGKLAAWECKCPCGKLFTALGSDIRKGKTKTCGCKKSIKSKRNWQGYEGLSKSYWRQLNLNAEQRNFEFLISIEYSWNLFEAQNKKCALSGVELSTKNNNHTASLDRIDSKKGYIPGNVQWVHRDVNKLKGSFDTDRLIELCKTIANYNI